MEADPQKKEVESPSTPAELPTLTVSSADWTRPGTMLGPYRIESVLGEGGMGVVYRALDTKLNRTVAVKVLSDKLADAAARRRFQREAQTASSLNHPHIVTVHDADEIDGRQFIVTEFVDGGTLKDWAKQQPRSWREIVELLVGVADGLATAHEANILHRDIKPGNVLVSKTGYAKLADFGLAKAVGDGETLASQELTQFGTIIGTVAYMSPEQASGQDLDARSDIFSFGVLLYELLGGRRPFGGASNAEVMGAVIHATPQPLPDTLPAQLRRTVEKAMKKNPADRFQTMRELAIELRSLVRQNAQPSGLAGRRLWFAVAAASLSLVVAGVAWRMWTQSAAAQVRSIAVLPFRNLSGDPSQEFLSDGTTEQLIANLTQIHALKVISRTSVMRYKNTSKLVADIGRELGVDALLEGSVQTSGGRVRVRAQLVRAASDAAIWSQDYDRDLSDALTLETDVARSIASAIRVDLTPAEITRLSARPIKPEALEPYLRARYYAFNLNNEDLKEATRLFEEVVRIQPDLAAAHAGIAGAWLTRLSFAGATPQDVETHARSEATKALELDPNSADAHVNMGMLYTSLDRKWAEAEKEFLEAQKLAPNLPDSYNDYSYMLIIVGRLPEAIAQIEHGLSLDSLNPEIRLTYGLALFRAKRYQEAETNYRLTLELDPKNVTAAGTQITLAEFRGDYTTALERLEKLLNLQGQDLSSSPVAARLYARMGRRADAERTFANAMKIPGSVLITQAAAYYLAMGDKQKALQELQKASGRLPILIKTDPLFETLHSEPAFIAILSQMGLAD